VSTYVPWNWHEEVEGQYSWSGDRDLEGFLKACSEEGIMVLLRAGPYVCGEWEFGGFPSWLLTKNATLRTYERNYIAQVDRWYGALMPKLKPHLYSNGGSVVLVQVENEYGSYGNVKENPDDKKYMEHLVEQATKLLGNGTVVLYTTDGGNTGYMERGSLAGPSVVTTGDGGWACDAQAQFNPPGRNPCMNSEDYTGWLTHWGESMANTSASDYGAAGALRANRSFNFYMGHGGTNFGWMSGANGGGKSFSPHITSYDYDSPISESGRHGFGSNGKDKFETIRTALLPFAPPGGFPAEPAPLPVKAYGPVKLTQYAPMLSDASLKILAPDGPKRMSSLSSMETLGQANGFVLYSANASKAGSTLEVVDYPRDRAQVFVGGVYMGAIYRPSASPLSLATPLQENARLDVLVENMGRLNYGTGMTDPKGITTDVTIDGESVATSWSALSMSLDYTQVRELAFAPIDSCNSSSGPVFYKGVLRIDGQPADTYLRPEGFTKGVMWVNGFNLGRYWETQGPQHAFFLPAPYLKSGDNDVIMLEVDQGSRTCSVVFDDRPDFSGKPAALCAGIPAEGDVVSLHDCDGTLQAHQGWRVTNASGSTTLSLGEFCLGLGPGTDAQSGSPAAQLHSCKSASVVKVVGSAITEAGGRCLDVTAHGAEAGEPVEWYACNGGSNQAWALSETPSHLYQVTSGVDGKCLSVCSATTAATEILV